MKSSAQEISDDIGVAHDNLIRVLGLGGLRTVEIFSEQQVASSIDFKLIPGYLIFFGLLNMMKGKHQNLELFLDLSKVVLIN